MEHKRSGSALTGPPIKNVNAISLNSVQAESPASKARSTSVASTATVAPSTSSSSPSNPSSSITSSTSAAAPPVPSAAISDASADAAKDMKLLQTRSTQLLDDPKLRDALVSDYGPSALLTRAKQSIVSTKEFATFLKKSASLESEHVASVKKVARNTRDAIKRPDGRQGTFYRQFDEVVRTNERICDVSNVYVAALATMHDELIELSKQTERVRKSIKETSLRQEKFVTDAESLAEKAKSKYDSLCEEYDRMRTGDPAKNKFGFKQSRTPQHEEELLRKVQSADSEYQQRVTQAQKARKDLIEKQRPATAKQLKDLILECDSGITYQLQKYANLNETLALNRGFIVIPIKDDIPTANPNLSMREKVSKIDNELDIYSFVMGTTKNKPLNRTMVKYQKHPTQGGSRSASTFVNQGAPTSSSSFNPTTSSFSQPAAAASSFNSTAVPSVPSSFTQPQPQRPSLVTTTSSSPFPPSTGSTAPVISSTIPVSKSVSPPPTTVGEGLSPVSTAASGLETTSTNTSTIGGSGISYPPGTTSTGQSWPVFGSPLEVLLEYEESTVPRVVYQCIQAVENFGLEIEGIYRTNGNSTQVQEIKRLFDMNSSNVDLLHPTSNVNDIHSVASALKLYFRDLPDPLLTRELHRDFIRAAQIENDVQRRDAVHATVNNLPDPNYTTLRYLSFHLYRVQEREAINRMSIGNLGIVWGPTLMATDYSNVSEMAIQGKVIETILYNAYVIFDAE